MESKSQPKASEGNFYEKNFCQAVKLMRLAQMKYFRTRCIEHLREAKAMEALVDVMLENMEQNKIGE